MEPATSYLTSIRGVDLLPGEKVAALFSPADGRVDEPPTSGQLLVATDRRFINLDDNGESKVRELFSLDSMAGLSVRDDVLRGFSWLQWLTLAAGGVVVYVALAYWMVDRLPRVIIPVINLHGFALVIMALVVLAGWLFWRGFTRPGGTTIRIHGGHWDVATRCTAPYQDLIGFANALSQMQAGLARSARSSDVAERQ